ncbi:hypothetical protein [Paracoccus sp. IB05]|uniref:hypothetical protein n=1 Tax=Paracoccus sp. IB05 TaxID=2779367 RepID=UPI0018E7A271|nr:hypothetical protein [Paracoccus sp. IB05]MBJ2153175.1 hypothetical protein [Paracoccus sp. IB05]
MLARVRDNLLHRVWLAGYSSYRPPGWLRWLLARSDWHRAWLLGHLGFFVEAGVAYGPANPYPGPPLLFDPD